MKKRKVTATFFAVLLAMQCILALIPVNTTAAAAPVIEELAVGNIKATIYNKTITAKVFTSDVTDNKIEVYFSVDAVHFTIHYEGESITNGGILDLSKFTHNADTYRTELLLRDTSTNLASMYNLIIEVSYASGDTSIATINMTASVGTITADSHNQLITGDIMYGVDLSSYTREDFQITLNDSVRGKWEWDAFTKKITVTAENGNKSAYSFALTPLDGLSAFTISGASSSVINQKAKTITIEMPYTSEENIPTGMLKASPSYTKTISGSSVSLGEDILLSSANKVDWIRAVNGQVPIHVKFIKDGREYKDMYTLSIVYPPNPNGEIKEIEIASASNSIREPGTIHGDNITATLAKGVSLENATLYIKASKNSTVRIPMQGKERTMTDETGFIELNNINLQGSVTIQVISEDEKVITRYTLTITKRSAFAEPAIFSLALKDSTGTVYEAQINDNSIVIKGLPYNTTLTQLEDMSLIYEISDGAALLDKNGETVARSGTKLKENVGVYIPSSVHIATPTRLTVLAQDEDNKQTNHYNVSIEANAAKEESDINEISFTLPDTEADKEETFTAKIATEQSGNGLTKNTAVLTIPFDTYYGHDYINIDDRLKKAIPNLILSEGAAAYYHDAANNKFVLMQSGRKTVKNFSFDFTDTCAIDTAKVIYILSEEVAYRIARYMGEADVTEDDFDMFLSSFASTKYTRYYVYAISSAARKGTDMSAFSITDANVTMDHRYQIVKLSIPWSYAADNISSPIVLIPEFSLSDGAGLWANVNGTKGGGLKVTSGGTYDSNGNWVKRSAHLAITRDSEGGFQTLYCFDGNDYTPIDALYVVNEGGTAFKKYSFQINIAAPEGGSSFQSFSLTGVNGRITGSAISIILPYGTNVKKLVPTFSTSKMASVYEHIYGGEIISSESEIDFTEKVKLTVYSEDNKNKTIYTISVSLADAFTDVKVTDWFYAEVMQAAAAGIVNGVGNGYFRPNNMLTRADFAVLVARMLDADLDSVTLDPFTDVQTTAYYYKAIAYGYEAGYLSGYENNNFKPYKTISRQEMAKIFAVVLDLDVNRSVAEFNDDNKIAAWAKDYIYACKAAGLMEGTNNNFNPSNTTTRAQAAAVIVRSLNFMK